jgi:hypothetical protein
MNRSHSRVTGALRLLTAVWLIAWSVRTLADPLNAVANQPMPLSVLLAVAGLSFTLGGFLLTGFMSRVGGLTLACLAGWQIARFGFDLLQVAEALLGIHFMLRGGGAWAMDIYVQKMQDRARRKATTHDSRPTGLGSS